jgi:hypothetical protein
MYQLGALVWRVIDGAHFDVNVEGRKPEPTVLRVLAPARSARPSLPCGSDRDDADKNDRHAY